MYKGYQFKVQTRQEFFLALQTFLVNQGWVLHDTYGATQGVGMIGFWSQPNDGNTITIGSRVYTFKDILTPAEGEVLKGANYAETGRNLKLAVNRTEPETNDGVKYKIASAHPDVVATVNTDNNQSFQKNAYGEGDLVRANTWGSMNWSSAFNGDNAIEVYKSNGETGNEPYGYVWIDNSRQNNCIEFRAHQFWDAVAHVGGRLAYNGGNGDYRKVAEFDYSYDCFLGGDKNFIYASPNAKSGQSYYSRSFATFGHIPRRCHAPVTPTTDAIVSGVNVSIPVVSSNGFIIGQEIQIVGIEGCDKMTLNAIPDAEHIIVSNLPRDYAAGAFVGLPGSVFGWYCPQAGVFYPCCHLTNSGTTVSGDGYSVGQLFSNTSPMTTDKKQMACPIYFQFSNVSNIGITDDNVLMTIMATHFDAAIMNNDGTFPVSSTVTSAANELLTDSTKNWTSNALIGKLVAITGSIGIGQVRKIVGNDATSITISPAWYTNPDNSSSYKICDKFFRGINNLLGPQNMSIFSITDTSTPSQA